MTKAKTWITREGEVMRVRDMEDSHLRNVLAYFRKRCKCLRYCTVMEISHYMDNAPDGAQMAAKGAFEDCMTLSDDEFLSQAIDGYENVLEEAGRRKL